MRYALLVALREYLENAKTKGFWIGIFMFPAMIAVAVVASIWLERAEPSRHFVVVDRSGAFLDAIDRAVEQAHQRAVLEALRRYVAQNTRSAEHRAADLSAIPLENGRRADDAAVEAFVAAGGMDGFLALYAPLLDENAPELEPPRREFVRVDLPPEIDAGAPSDEIVAALRPYLAGERRISADGRPARLFAALVIERDALDAVLHGDAGPAERPAIQYWSANLTDDDLPDLVGNALNDEARRRLYVARGVDVATVRDIERLRVRVGFFDPGKAEGEETVSIADRVVRAAPLGFVYFLWISIFSIMQMLLNNTIEEKSNRIAEVLLSSVTAGEIMMGKLLGIAAVGLTMVGAWLAAAFAGLALYRGAGAEVVGQVLDAVAASGLVPMFLLCFLLGYLIYAGLFLAIGALCNDLKEAQNLQGPMMLIMLVPLITMMFINRDPHGTLATTMTWIPLYTPFTMMNRAAADPPLLELAGATLLMVATAALLLWSAGRIFKAGILRTGNRPRLGEVVQWIRGRADG